MPPVVKWVIIVFELEALGIISNAFLGFVLCNQSLIPLLILATNYFSA